MPVPSLKSVNLSLAVLYSVFTGDTLLYAVTFEFLHMLFHAVTLTFDLLILNIYSTAGVVRLNIVHNLREID